MDLEEIRFDESDKNLFQVDDPRLRADAIRHSVLPRLRLLLNYCVSLIAEVYELEAFEDSIISYYPQFRTKRSVELGLLYEAAFAGLAGKRVKNKWLGVEKKDGKPVHFLPFRYGLQLTEEGLIIYLENYWLKGLTDDSHRKLFDFHLAHEEIIHSLCYGSRMKPELYSGEGVEPISTFRQHYEYMLREKLFQNDFTSSTWTYPISTDALIDLTFSFICFFPVYDSYLQIAMGKPIRFSELISKLNAWIKRTDDSLGEADGAVVSETPASYESILRAKEAAEQRVKVMPAMRWRVFQKDRWKCVSCGRGSEDDVVLHIDHIIPRSRGGKDEIENYQTLCHLCNIGKSNRDDTDLRKLKAES